MGKIIGILIIFVYLSLYYNGIFTRIHPESIERPIIILLPLIGIVGAILSEIKKRKTAFYHAENDWILFLMFIMPVAIMGFMSFLVLLVFLNAVGLPQLFDWLLRKVVGWLNKVDVITLLLAVLLVLLINHSILLKRLEKIFRQYLKHLKEGGK